MNVPPRSRLELGLIAFGVIVAAIDLVVVRAAVPSWSDTLLYAGSIVVLLVPMGLAVIRRPVWAKPSWLIFLVVLSLHVVGLLVRQVTQGGQRSADLQVAGGADILFAVAYSSALVALLLMIRRVHRRSEPLWFIDAAIVFVAAWTVGAELILLPMANRDAALLPDLIQAFYLTVNAGLLGVAVRLGLTAQPGVNRALRTGLIGVVIFAVNDIVSTSGLITGTEMGIRSGIYTAGNVLAITLIAAAAVDATSLNPPARTPHEGRLSATRSVLAVFFGIVVLSTAVFLVWPAPRGMAVLLVLLALLMASLLTARSLTLVRAYQQVVRQEEALRAGTAAMTAAESADQIDAALESALASVLPGELPTHRWVSSQATPLGATMTLAAPRSKLIRPIPGQDRQDYTYSYSHAIGADQLQLTLVTELLLDPLDWSAAESLAEVAVQARAQQRLRAEREQSEEAARLTSLLAGAQDMVVLLDDTQRISIAVGAVDDLTGQPAQWWVGRRLAELFAEPTAVLAAVAAGGNRRRRADGQIIGTEAMVEATVVPAPGGEVSVSLHDITERLSLTSELDFRAHHDALTGLPNRRMLQQLLVDADRERCENGRPYAVVHVDLDDFKVVNDSLGHRLGNALLVAASDRFCKVLGARGTVARLGADEFALLLPDTDLAGALEVASEVVGSLGEPVVIEGVEILVRASAGVAAAEVSDHGEEGGTQIADGEFLLHAADLALYDAREKGKGQVAPFRGELRELAARRLHDANAVTAAAREHAFRFDYQPIVDVSEHHVLALEALMRWDSGEELNRPDSFIPIAESLGELTGMLRDAIPDGLDRLVAWRRLQPDLQLAVNMHAGALLDAEFLEWFGAALTERGLPTSAVILEVSERSLLPQQAERNLNRLRRRGVPIWIDDFGTGWSNLSVLDRLPVTGVKLARELVVDEDGAVKEDLVRAARALADAVGFTVTAEGVETPEQLAALCRLGVPIVQGYLISRPMSAGQADEWLTWYDRGGNADATTSTAPPSVPGP